MSTINIVGLNALCRKTCSDTFLPMSFEQHIASAIAELGLSIHESRVSRLAHFVDLLLEYNKRTSLTALKTGEEVVRNLLADSLATSMAMGFDLSRECLDLGAGGGFPSIVLG